MNTNNQKKFVKAPELMLFDLQLRPIDVRVYLVLRSYRNERTQEPVYPSKNTIAKSISCSSDTVDRSIKRLVKQCHISYVKGHTGRSNTYQFIDEVAGDGRTGAAMSDARERSDNRTNADEMGAPSRHQPKSINHKHKPEEKPRLYHGKDPAYIEEDGEVTIKTLSGRVPWSHYGVEEFRFGNLCGEMALQAARKYYLSGTGSNHNKSDTIPSLPSNWESLDSLISQRSPFDNLNND
jgi:hypothetical protein